VRKRWRHEGRDGALSIQPFEGSRVTTLWDLNGVFRAGREPVEEKEVRGGRGSEAEEVMGVQVDLDRERWTRSKKVLAGRRGTQRMLGRKALRLLGVAASVSCVPREGKGWRTQSDLGGAESLQDGHGPAALGTDPERGRRWGGGGNLPVL
jgi:hypothetical protein